MDDLHCRAKAFLSGPRPLAEPAGTMTRLIAQYVAGQSWEDPELGKRLSDCLDAAKMEAVRYADAPSGPAADARLFYQRGAEILQGIQARGALGRT